MSVDVPVCEIDFYSAATIADPVKAYAAMLNLGPVVWLKHNSLHAICGYKEVVSALRDHEHFSSGKGVSVDDTVNKMLIGSTLNSDPPQHDVTRKITFAPLSPKNVRLVKEQIEKEAKNIVDKLLARQQFDLSLIHI